MRKRTIVFGALLLGLVLLVIALLPYAVMLLMTRNEEFRILSQTRDETTDYYLILVFSPGQMTDVGSSQLIAEKRPLSDADAFPVPTTLIASIKEGGMVPTLAFKDACYVIRTKGTSHAMRFDRSWYSLWIGGGIKLESGQRWHEEIGGKSICFAYENPP